MKLACSLLGLLLLLAGPARADEPATRVAGKTFGEWVQALKAGSDSAAKVAGHLDAFERRDDPDLCCEPVLPRDAARHVPALLTALSNGDPKVRAGLASTLGKIAAPAAATPLSRLLNDPEPAVQRAASRALARIGAPAVKVLDALLKALTGADRQVVGSCLDAIAAAGKPARAKAQAAVERCAGRADTLLRAKALRTLAALGDTSNLTALVAIARDEQTGYRQRCAALEGLGYCGPTAAPALGKLLTRVHDDEQKLRTAVDALVRIGGAAAVRVLTATLSQPREEVRVEAALGLGRIGPAAAPALPKLIAMLHDAKRSCCHERGRIALAIGGGADPERRSGDFPGLGPGVAKQAVPALIAVLDRYEVGGKEEPALVARTAVALSRFGRAAASALPTLDRLGTSLGAVPETAIVLRAAKVIRAAAQRRRSAQSPASKSPKSAQPLTPSPSRKAPGR